MSPGKLDVDRWPLNLDRDLLAPQVGDVHLPDRRGRKAAPCRNDRTTAPACDRVPRERPARHARTGTARCDRAGRRAASQYSIDRMSGCRASIWPNLMKLPPRSSNSRRNRCGPGSLAKAKRPTSHGHRLAYRATRCARPCARSTRAMWSNRRTFIPKVFTLASPADDGALMVVHGVAAEHVAEGDRRGSNVKWRRPG